jgi:hypothetical protein
MAEDSQAMWVAKTMGLVLLVAVLTALLTTGIQQLVWGESNGGVSGGAAAGVAVAVMMSRRKRLPAKTPPAPPA